MNGSHLETLKNKSDEELIRLFYSEANLKGDIDAYLLGANGINKDDLNKLMLVEYRKVIQEFIDENVNHKAYSWSVVIQRIRNKVLNKN